MITLEEYKMFAPDDKSKVVFQPMDFFKEGPAEFFKNFPRHELWRFFIEGDRQNDGEELIIRHFKKVDEELKSIGSEICCLDCPIKTLLDEKIYEKIPKEYHDKFKQHQEDLEFFIKKFHEDPNLTVRELGLRLKGWLPFEKTEPGYIAALINRFVAFGEEKKEQITCEYIQALHKAATQNVNNLEYNHKLSKEAKQKPGEWRSIQASTALNFTDVSLEGIKEILHMMDQEKPEDACHITIVGELSNIHYNNKGNNNDELAQKIMEDIQNGVEIRLATRIKESAEQKMPAIIMAKMNNLIKKYEEDILKAKKPIEKLYAIAEFIAHAERLHPFIDANGRTFCMLLVSFLMMKNGFPPPILQNSNRFEGFSVKELVEDLILGMQNTMQVAKGHKNLYGVTTEDILAVATPKEREYAKIVGIKLPTPESPRLSV